MEILTFVAGVGRAGPFRSGGPGDLVAVGRVEAVVADPNVGVAIPVLIVLRVADIYFALCRDRDGARGLAEG